MSTEWKAPGWLAEHYDKQKARSAAIVEQAIIDLIVSGEKVTEESVVEEHRPGRSRRVAQHAAPEPRVPEAVRAGAGRPG